MPRTLERRRHLVDAELDEELANRGFVVLSDRLPTAQVRALAELYRGAMDEIGRDDSGVFLPSMMIDRPEVRARLWDGVAALTTPTLAASLDPTAMSVIGGSFVSKPGSTNSLRSPHQDQSVFDEARFVSLSVWIPLSSSDIGNGTLHLLPGSHRMGNHVRPPDVESLDAEVQAIAERESEPVELDPGQLLVIDGAVVHHSPPNGSGAERVAAICALAPSGARMRYLTSEGGAPRGTATIHDTGIELYRRGDLRHPDLQGTPVLGHAPYRPATAADLARSRAAG